MKSVRLNKEKVRDWAVSPDDMLLAWPRWVGARAWLSPRLADAEVALMRRLLSLASRRLVARGYRLRVD